ncbi:MAG: CotH kinase family protein, partial [Clostridia bacterium]|nr:CotH kinase family protein [Clostridia bacterium]
MKKIIALILAVVMSISAFAVCGFADDAPAVSNVYVEQKDLTSDDTDRVVNWYEANGEYYLFIPASVNSLFADFVVDSSEKVYVDGAEYTQTQKLVSVIGDKKQITLKAGDEEYKLNIIDGSKIASVFITTESGSLDYIHQDKSNKEEGFIEIVDAAGVAVYDGVLDQIKGRGNSTWNNPKKPYNIKLDEKANLFGMGKSKKWSLLANYGDESLIRNSAVFSAAQKTGVPYTPMGVSCDVYINGNYEGVYLLTTRVEVDKTRVNIDNLDDLNEEICQEFYNDKDFDMDTLDRGGYYGKFGGLLEGTMKWVDIPVPADSSAT